MEFSWTDRVRNEEVFHIESRAAGKSYRQ